MFSVPLEEFSESTTHRVGHASKFVFFFFFPVNHLIAYLHQYFAVIS